MRGINTMAEAHTYLQRHSTLIIPESTDNYLVPGPSFLGELAKEKVIEAMGQLIVAQVIENQAPITPVSTTDQQPKMAK